jgi:pyruvate dehydrogenase (quinone)/pyruvate oxidase
MAQTASDILIDILQEWGVDTIFGLPGDGINGIMEALRKRAEHIRFVQVRHEEAAAFMGVRVRKVYWALGVCVATSGPGGIHCLTDFTMPSSTVNRYWRSPACRITTSSVRSPNRMSSSTSCSWMLRSTTRASWGRRTSRISRILPAARRCSIAASLTSRFLWTSRRCRRTASARSGTFAQHAETDIASQSARLPNDTDLAQAADILNNGKKVVILAGRGALNAGAELEKVAEVLGAPIVKPLLGKARCRTTVRTRREALDCSAHARRRRRSSRATRC